MINGGAATDILIQICVSAGLIFVVYKSVSPVVIKIFSFGKQEANYLCVMPLTAYIITYATTVYSDVLFKYPSITIPLLTTVMSVSFIGFEVYFFNYSAEKSNLQHAQELFKMQINSAKKLFLSKAEEKIRPQIRFYRCINMPQRKKTFFSHAAANSRRIQIPPKCLQFFHIF